MNRTERAKVRAAREALDVSRAFKNDALEESINSSYDRKKKRERFKSELSWYKGKKKEVRILKKYNGRTGVLSESNYQEIMGC